MRFAPEINWRSPQAVGLVGCWLFAPSRGTKKLRNLVSFGNDGTIGFGSSSQSWKEDPSNSWGAGLYHLGTGSQNTRVARYSALEPATAYTIDAWVFVLATVSGFRQIVAKEFNLHAGPEFTSFALYSNNALDGGVTFFNTTDLNNNHALTSVATPMTAGALVHIAGTFDSDLASNEKKLFLNGKFDTQASLTGTPKYDTDSGGDLSMGESLAATDRLDDVIILSVRVWNRALPAELVRHLWEPSTRYDLYERRKTFGRVPAPSGDDGISGRTLMTLSGVGR